MVTRTLIALLAALALAAPAHGQAGHEHQAAATPAPSAAPAAHSHADSHSHPAPDDGRPVREVLVVFGAVNALILILGWVSRQQPASVKRRAVLARVRG